MYLILNLHSDLFFVGTGDYKIYIIAEQGKGHFEILGNYISNDKFFIRDDIIKYASCDTNNNFLYLIEKYVVLIKADIWKMYYLEYRDINDSVSPHLSDT